MVVIWLLLNSLGLASEFRFGHDGWCAARRGVAGANFVRYGFVENRFAPVQTADWVQPEKRHVYWHHPPGMQNLLGVSFTLFGKGEWQARLVPFLAMLLGLGLWAGIGKRVLVTREARFTSCLLFATLPMQVVYGVFVGMEPLVVVGGVASVWAYLRLLAASSSTRESEGALRPRALLGLTGVIAFAAAYSGWSWFLISFALLLVELVRAMLQGALRWRWLLVHCACTLLGFCLVTWHLMMVQGTQDHWSAFKAIFMSRHAQAEGIFTLGRVVDIQGQQWLALFTPLAVGAGALFLLFSLVDLVRGRLSLRQGVAFVFLAAAFVWVRVFLQGAEVHEYWPNLAAPFFVMAGADLVDRLFTWRPAKPWLARTVWLGLLSLELVHCVSGVVFRRQHPAYAHAAAGTDYHQRDVVLWKWLNTQVASGRTAVFDRRALDGAVTHQRRFYLDRWEQGADFVRGPLTRGRPDWQVAVIDLRRFPAEHLKRVLVDSISHYETTALDDFLVAHLERPVVQPRLKYLRSETPPRGFAKAWLNAGLAQGERYVDDPLLAAQLLQRAGLKNEALTALTRVKPGYGPDDLAHSVARHNLELAAGHTPRAPSAWLSHYLPDVRKRSTLLASDAWVQVRRMERLAMVLTVPAPASPAPSIHLAVSAQKGALRIRPRLLSPPPDTTELSPGALLLVQGMALVPEKEQDPEPRFLVQIPPSASVSQRAEQYVLPCRDSAWPVWLRDLLGLWWIGV